MNIFIPERKVSLLLVLLNVCIFMNELFPNFFLFIVHPTMPKLKEVIMAIIHFVDTVSSNI